MSAGSAAALLGDRRTILLVDLTPLRQNLEAGKHVGCVPWMSAGTDIVVLPSLVSMTHSEYALVLEALRAYHVPPEMNSTGLPGPSAFSNNHI